jgi:EamA-like transporter family
MLVLQPGANLDTIGILAAVAGTVSMATGVVLTKHWGRPVGLIAFTGWQLAAGGLVLAPVVVLAEGLSSTITGTNLAGFGWLAIIGTGLAYANWFRGVQALPIAVTSFLGLLSPLVAAAVGTSRAKVAPRGPQPPRGPVLSDTTDNTRQAHRRGTSNRRRTAVRATAAPTGSSSLGSYR